MHEIRIGYRIVKDEFNMWRSNHSACSVVVVTGGSYWGGSGGGAGG